MQRANCNLQLSLDLGCSNNPKSSREESLESSTATMDQHFAFFCKGQLCDFDVTDFQARAIIWCASREMDERRSSPISSPTTRFQLCSPPGSSVKRSLQRFLQERKNRIRATSPYKYPLPSIYKINPKLAPLPHQSVVN